MAEPTDGIDVVRATPEHWRIYRDVRLAALIDSPRAFWTTYPQAAERTDEDWRDLLAGAPVWLALDGRRPLGTVGLRRLGDRPESEAHLVGMWVASHARGGPVAETLVRAALAQARAEGRTTVRLEVLRENRRAWNFYSRMGFRPTGETATMPWDATAVEEAMVLADLFAR